MPTASIALTCDRASSRHLPHDEAECIHIRLLVCIKVVLCYSLVQHLGSHVPLRALTGVGGQIHFARLTEITQRNEFEFFGYLMTLGLSKDIQCHVRPQSFLCLQITRSDWHQATHVKWAVRRMTADGQLIFLTDLCWYVWVNIITLSPPRVHKNVSPCMSFITS